MNLCTLYKNGAGMGASLVSAMSPGRCHTLLSHLNPENQPFLNVNDESTKVSESNVHFETAQSNDSIETGLFFYTIY
jgi:hypothetical protein